MEAALNFTTFLTQAQALLGKAIGEHTTQQNEDVKSIINKDRQVASKTDATWRAFCGEHT